MTSQNDITKEKLYKIGEHQLRYSLKKWVKKGNFDIINDISEHFTLVQSMDTLGNVNNNIIIVGYWIFGSNYEEALHLTRELLGIICYPSVSEEQVVKFGTVFTLLDTSGHQRTLDGLNMKILVK